MADEIRSPARKRVRRLESTRDSSSSGKELETESEFGCKTPSPLSAETPEANFNTHDDGIDFTPSTQTELETSLPSVRTDQEAIDEYEASNASYDIKPGTENLQERYENRAWVKGKSSIYVDAFNLALQCVLEEEAHLFDHREMALFNHWKGLSYQSQYL